MYLHAHYSKETASYTDVLLVFCFYNLGATDEEMYKTSSGSGFSAEISNPLEFWCTTPTT